MGLCPSTTQEDHNQNTAVFRSYEQLDQQISNIQQHLNQMRSDLNDERKFIRFYHDTLQLVSKDKHLFRCNKMVGKLNVLLDQSANVGVANENKTEPTCADAKNKTAPTTSDNTKSDTDIDVKVFNTKPKPNLNIYSDDPKDWTRHENWQAWSKWMQTSMSHETLFVFGPSQDGTEILCTMTSETFVFGSQSFLRSEHDFLTTILKILSDRIQDNHSYLRYIILRWKSKFGDIKPLVSFSESDMRQSETIFFLRLDRKTPDFFINTLAYSDSYV